MAKNKSDQRFVLVMVGVVAVMAVVLIAIYAMRDSSDDAGDAEEAPVASTAADFELPGLDGQVRLADFRGQYVLVNFWATWCPPCKAEMPDLFAYHREHQDEGFTLLAVNQQENAQTARSFMDANNFDFPVALDETGLVSMRYNVQGLPSSFLVGPDGNVVKTWPAGMISAATLERDVTPLLQG